MTQILTLIFSMIGSCFTWLFSDMSQGFSFGWVMITVALICLLMSYFMKGN